MKDFVFWVTVAVGIEMAFRIVWLALFKSLPERTGGGCAIDMLLMLGLLVWGCRLLS